MATLAIVTVTSLLYPLLTRSIIDDGLISKDPQIVIILAAIMVGLYLLDSIIQYINAHITTKLTLNISQDLYKAVFDKLFKIEIQYFKEKNNSETINEIDVDINTLSNLADDKLLDIFTEFFRLIGGTIGLLLISPKLFILVLVYIPLRYIVIHVLSKKIEKETEKNNDLTSNLANDQEESYRCVETIRMSNMQAKESQKLNESVSKMLSSDRKITIINILQGLYDDFLGKGLVLSIFIGGSFLIVSNSISVGSIVAFIEYTSLVINPIGTILGIKMTIAGIIPSTKRLQKLLSEKEEADTGDLCMPEDVESIVFESVSHKYNQNIQVLDDVDIKLVNPRKIAILGENGSGKTTLMNLLFRLHIQQEGEIFINDVSNNEYDLASYRNAFGVVSQNAAVFNTSIRNNITLFSDVDSKKYEEILDLVNLTELEIEKGEDPVGINGAEISGGQKQKITIARTLLQDKKIIVLDEAFSNLDKRTRDKLEKYFFNLKKLIIFITHDAHILNKIDHIIFLENGTAKLQGTHSELLKHDTYFNYLNKFKTN